MNILFYLSILLGTSVYIATGDTTCTTSTGAQGECVPIYDCEVLLGLVQKPNITAQDRELLKKSMCNNTTNTVCCPLKCKTPDGLTGKCVDIDSCANLTKTEDKKYLEQSGCKGDDSHKVCCSLPVPAPNRHLNKKCTAQLSAFPPDPSSRCCGYDSSTGNRILGGKEVGVDQHPWLAMVEFNKEGKEYLLCGGALISGRYVLTAAHCTNLNVVKVFGKPKLVRLGEYDVSHEGPDCVTVEAGGQDCTDGVTKINVESHTLHPEYDMVTRKNDIALLRLEKMAPFSEFIRPVCLPTNDITLKPPEDLRLYVAGWGATETKLFSATKLYVDLPYVPLEKCQTSYTKPPLQIQLWDRQLCAGGEPGRDACRGDSGGPLVYDSGKIFEAIGLVSFGPSQCSLEDVPGVYTNIYPYIDWMLNTIIE